jgi:hypothetical protein
LSIERGAHRGQRKAAAVIGRLSLRRALPLIATLGIASWVAVIGVVCLGRLTICYLVGI